MLIWLLVAILSYFFFSLAFFGDKLVLNGPASPKVYTFYVGILNIVVIFLIPFVDFKLYNVAGFFFALLVAITSLLGIYTMFSALEKFEASRVIPTIGATQPILILILTWFFWGSQALTATNFLAFGLLCVGSVVISLEKKLTITAAYLFLTLFSSLMFSLAYVFSKLVFLNQSFIPGMALIGMCTFVIALVFLFDKALRHQVFSKKAPMGKKTRVLFLCTQSAGGIANVLQSLAISLVPVSYLAIVNSLRGLQYVFLFLITLFFSVFYPKILKEDIAQKIIIQKVTAIVIIVLGLAILVK